MLKTVITNSILPEAAFLIVFTQKDMDNFARIFKNTIETESGVPANLTKSDVRWYISAFFMFNSIPEEKQGKLCSMIADIKDSSDKGFCDYIFLATRFDREFKIPRFIINFVLDHREEIDWTEVDSDEFFQWLSSKENAEALLEDIEIANKLMSEDRNEEEDDEEYYFDEEDKETINTNTYIYKLPNLATLLHIPVCRGQVFEGYDHRYYLESEQFLQDFLDEVKYPITKYQVKIKDMEDFYQQIPKDTVQIELD